MKFSSQPIDFYIQIFPLSLDIIYLCVNSICINHFSLLFASMNQKIETEIEGLPRSEIDVVKQRRRRGDKKYKNVRTKEIEVVNEHFIKKNQSVRFSVLFDCILQNTGRVESREVQYRFLIDVSCMDPVNVMFLSPALSQSPVKVSYNALPFSHCSLLCFVVESSLMQFLFTYYYQLSVFRLFCQDQFIRLGPADIYYWSALLTNDFNLEENGACIPAAKVFVRSVSLLRVFYRDYERRRKDYELVLLSDCIVRHISRSQRNLRFVGGFQLTCAQCLENTLWYVIYVQACNLRLA